MSQPPQKPLSQKWMRSLPHDGPSSHWTTALNRHTFSVGLAIFTLFHFWLAAILPPAEDELYYWTWAQNLQLSYFDHPPLVSYLIWLSTKIFGDTLFGIRFFSCIASLAILLSLRKLSRSGYVLTFVIFTPLFLWGSVLMTPDTPLLFFWTAYLLWMVWINHPLTEWSLNPLSRVYHRSPVPIPAWVAGGILLGLGMLGKYSMYLAVPCSFLVLVTLHEKRAWMLGFGVHLLVALVVSSPILIFNIQHDWVSFRYQWANSMEAHGLSLSRSLEFWASQIVLVGGLPLMMMPWVLAQRSLLSNDKVLHVCFYFFVFPMVFFFFQSLRTKLEANWALIAYLSFWPMAQRLLDWSSFKAFGKSLLYLSFLPAILFSVLLLVHLFHPLKWVPPEQDRFTRMGTQYALSQQVADELRTKQGPIYTCNYQWTSYLRFQKIPALQIHPSGRMSHFTLPPQDPCQYAGILYFTDNKELGDAAQATKCFFKSTVQKEYPLMVRGVEVARYYLIELTK